MIFEFLEIKRSARSLFGCRSASTGAEKIYGTPDNPIFESINCVRQMFAVLGGDILYLSTALCLNEIYRGARLSSRARSDCSVRTRGINFCKNAERYITSEKRKVGIECWEAHWRWLLVSARMVPSRIPSAREIHFSHDSLPYVSFSHDREDGRFSKEKRLYNI